MCSKRYPKSAKKTHDSIRIERKKKRSNLKLFGRSFLMMITPSRSTIADNLISLLKRNRPGLSNVELKSFKNRLLKDDFIEVGTVSYDRPIEILSDFECLISFDFNFTWEWSEETLISPSSCQKFIINIINLSVTIRRKQVQNDIVSEENSNCNGENKDTFLLSWFFKCTPIVETIIHYLNADIDSNLDVSTAHNIMFELWSTGFLSTLFPTGSSILTLVTKSQSSIVKLHNITMSHKSSIGRMLKFTLKGCAWETDTTSWKIDEVVFQYPLLVYHLSGSIRGIKIEVSPTSIVATVIDKLASLRLDGMGFSFHLKYIVPNVNIVYKMDQGLQISLSKDIILSHHYDIICMNALKHISLSCPITFTSPKFTLQGKEDDMHIHMENLSVELTNSSISTNVVVQADAFHYGNFIQISSLFLQCGLDCICTTADSFQLKVRLLSFQPSDDGVKWLERYISSLEFAMELDRETQLKVPFGCISESDVHFHRTVMNIFDFSKYSLESILGDEESTISSLLLVNARRLLKEVNRRRKDQKEQRKDMADSTAISVGSALLATSVATPIGAAVSIAALGARDQVGKAVISGKQQRGVSEHESYKFGDFSRGLMAKFRNSNSDYGDTPSKDSILRDKRRLAGVGGMSAGAIAGSVLLGPIGIAAGAMVGSRVAKAHVTSEEDDFSDKDHMEDS